MRHKAGSIYLPQYFEKGRASAHASNGLPMLPGIANCPTNMQSRETPLHTLARGALQQPQKGNSLWRSAEAFLRTCREMLEYRPGCPWRTPPPPRPTPRSLTDAMSRLSSAQRLATDFALVRGRFVNTCASIICCSPQERVFLLQSVISRATVAPQIKC